MAPFPCWLSAGQACNVLGIDPFSPAPDYVTMRRYIRNLQMLLHPDRILTSSSADRAQQELGIDFKALRAIEGYLFPTNCTESNSKYDLRVESLCNEAKRSRCWVSQWNPHKLEGGDMFEPLPAWTRWRSTTADAESGRASSSGTQDTHGGTGIRRTRSKRFQRRDISRVDVSKFRPSSVPGAPLFDGSDLSNPLVPEEGTKSLLRFIRNSDIVRGPNIGVAVATAQMGWGDENGQATTACTAEAIIEMPPQSQGRRVFAEDLPVTLLLKTKNGTPVKSNTYLRVVSPVLWHDLSTSPVWCPGPDGSGGRYGIDRMRLVVTHWNGVFASSSANGRYVAEFLSRVAKALSE
ncbi:hypothetical protein SLS55_010642 [Diplodia seriata]|uniref:J domain-containing protein n=1 Tax=Diplodia seriata TaxID=420778 RepID=A0ABR3BYG1_9PEZI